MLKLGKLSATGERSPTVDSPSGMPIIQPAAIAIRAGGKLNFLADHHITPAQTATVTNVKLNVAVLGNPTDKYLN